MINCYCFLESLCFAHVLAFAVILDSSLPPHIQFINTLTSFIFTVCPGSDPSTAFPNLPLCPCLCQLPSSAPVCFLHSSRHDPFKTKSDHIISFFQTFQIISVFTPAYVICPPSAPILLCSHLLSLSFTSLLRSPCFLSVPAQHSERAPTSGPLHLPSFYLEPSSLRYWHGSLINFIQVSTGSQDKIGLYAT